MIWDDTYPDGSIIEANILHTVLQTVKTVIRERAQANNGTFDEHSFYGDSADGTHDLSRVGFVKVWTTLANITGEVGTIHYLNSSDTDEGFYVITESGAVKITTPYHANLDGLDDDDHTQLLLEDGSRAMQTTLTCNSGSLTINDYITGNSSPVPKSHNDLSWYDAHGAECIVDRHIPNSSVGIAKLVHSGLSSHLNGAVSTYTVSSADIGRDDGSDSQYWGFPQNELDASDYGSNAYIDTFEMIGNNGYMNTIYIVWHNINAYVYFGWCHPGYHVSELDE